MTNSLRLMRRLLLHAALATAWLRTACAFRSSPSDAHCAAWARTPLRPRDAPRTDAPRTATSRLPSRPPPRSSRRRGDDARRAAPAAGDEEELLYGLPRATVAEPLALLLCSQFVLFVGVGAVLPAIPLYAR